MSEQLMKKLPVLVLAFNRPDHVAQSLEAIRQYRPSRIYLECDGARQEKPGEEKVVRETRETMLRAVDWPCSIYTRFRDKNLGCAEAVYDAINWFFESEEYGIICEDDIVLSPDFFALCEDLLVRYKDVDRVMEITARNESGRTDIPNTYVYLQRCQCWGWATWRRAWKKMDMSMSAAPGISRWYMVRRLGLFQGLVSKHNFLRSHRRLPNVSSWATRWFLTILAHDGLSIWPGVNLAINIGMQDGTHYSSSVKDPYKGLTLGHIQWPLVYNDTFRPDRIQQKYHRRLYFNLRLAGLKRRFSQFFRISN